MPIRRRIGLTTIIAMDASVRLVGPAGLREIKVADFVTGAMETAIEDGEVIVQVLVPRLSPKAHGAMPSTPRSLAILLNP